MNILENLDAITALAIRVRDDDFTGADMALCRIMDIDDVAPFTKNPEMISDLVEEFGLLFDVTFTATVSPDVDGFYAIIRCGDDDTEGEAIGNTPAQAIFAAFVYFLEAEGHCEAMNAEAARPLMNHSV